MSIKSEWVKALRSGGYDQCSSRLRNGDSYCCLGVLADITEGNRWEGDLLIDFSGRENKLVWCPTGKEKVEFLAGLNDAGYSFREIATVVEEMFDNNLNLLVNDMYFDGYIEGLKRGGNRRVS